MSTLAEILLAPHRKEALTADCVRIVEHHLNSLRSLRGLALKAGLAVLKATRPDLIPRAINRLLPDLIEALEPLYARFGQTSDRDFSLFLRKNADEAIEALRRKIDGRAAESSNEAAKSTYRKLRGTLHEEIETLFPELSKTLSGYLN
ncbi:DUF6918 family protein [Hydrocarboniphaga effusa]|jgi:hypothetical protein|uniref:DUF6918 family protein n=1 Tax=Hydrocarboniphaga effusa TaxID=243629 RepID=UPI0035B18233